MAVKVQSDQTRLTQPTPIRSFADIHPNNRMPAHARHEVERRPESAVVAASASPAMKVPINGTSAKRGVPRRQPAWSAAGRAQSRPALTELTDQQLAAAAAQHGAVIVPASEWEELTTTAALARQVADTDWLMP